MSKTESAIQWMENHANNNAFGYDQRYRWGEKGDFDCSSAVISAWQAAGVPVKTRGATYTGNMLSGSRCAGENKRRYLYRQHAFRLLVLWL